MRDGRMDEFVAEVRARSDIVPVVQGYVPLKRKGNRYWGCCPFHHEKTPSFSVVPDKGFFYCFGCHAGGDVFKFISLIESITYFEAIKLQAEKLNIPLPERQLSPEQENQERERQALYKVNEMAGKFFHNCLTMTGYGEPGRAYLAGRGISSEIIEEFFLGFAPNAWEKLTQAFLKRGVDRELLLKAGLSLPGKKENGLYDKFRGRVIIPIADERGRICGFGGRVLGDGQPKYLNTGETIIFNKRRLLFGLDRAKRAIQLEDYVIVVEGYMDAISVFGAGVQNVVASLGTAFTVEHAKKLMRYTHNLFFCYDSDEAGQQATIRALSLVVKATGAVLKVITVPDGKDPDEFIRKHGAEAFRSLVEKALPLVDYRWQYVLKNSQYDTAEGKNQALRAMLPVLSGLSDTVLSEYTKSLAQTLLIDEGLIREELRRYRQQPPNVEDVPAREPVRQVVRENDTALRKAGRLLIRAAYQDTEVLEDILKALPLEGIQDEVQREVLHAIQKRGEAGTQPDLSGMSESAAEELSRALVEDLGGREEAEAYADSLKVLRHAYLSAQYLFHTQRAESLLKAGDAAYIDELKEAKGIKDEMDEK